MKAARVVPLLVPLVLACGEVTPASPAAAPPSPPPPTAVVPVTVASNAEAAASAIPPKPAPAYAPSTPGNELSLKMLRALKAEKGNLFFSGTSLRGALGLTALGAKTKTLDELAQTLAVPADAARNAAEAKTERDAWKSAAGKSELVIANRLWVDRAFALDKDFVARAESGYAAGVASADFAKAPEPSRKAINTWVTQATNGKIPDLLPEGAIVPQTRLVLTNAIYFKGSWAHAFPKAQTKDATFTSGASALSVPFMHETETLRFRENEEASVVELPYRDADLAMMIVLPKDASRLDEIVSDLSAGKVDAWAKNLDDAKVSLSLPRFTFSWGRSVKAELIAMGVTTAFTNAADFSAIALPGKEALLVSDVFHKAFVAVDETGTEAAAATGVVMVPRSARIEKVIDLKVDHPFLFFIRSTKTGDILFAGRVVNPKA